MKVLINCKRPSDWEDGILEHFGQEPYVERIREYYAKLRPTHDSYGNKLSHSNAPMPAVNEVCKELGITNFCQPFEAEVPDDTLALLQLLHELGRVTVDMGTSPPTLTFQNDYD